MIPYGRGPLAAPPPSGTIGPLVAFEGDTDYIHSPPTMTPTPEATIVFRIRLDEAPAFLDDIFGFDGGGMEFENVGGAEKGLFFNLITTTASSPFRSQTSTTFGNGDVMACMLALDTAGGLTGSNVASLYVNGSQVLSSDDALTGNWDFNATQSFHFMNNSDGAGTSCACSCNGLWIANSALDPATHWSDFFDGSNQFQALPSNGVVQGVTPGFWQNGDATAWNSGTDNNGGSYTMVGTVT